MIKRILKLVLLFALISYILVDFTQAGFFEQIESYGNTFSTIDWTPPPIPQLRTPTDGASVNSLASLEQTWTAVEDTYSNPVTYFYESCNTDPGLSGGVCSSIHGVDSFTEADKQFIDGEWRIVRDATGEAEGTFWWRAKSIDALGNESDWSEVWQLTVDNTLPVISSISAVPGGTMALINWTTDELASSQVEYGIDITYGSVTAEDSTLLTTHAETLIGLTANTLYHFRVYSKDAAGNEIVSSDQTFTTNPHPVISGDVVINELMWMGTSLSTADEWIELRNMKDYEIDLSGWQITRKFGGTEVLMLTIPSGKTIAANGYFLISNYQSSSSQINDSIISDLITTAVALNNSDLQIKLYKDDWTNITNLIDSADDGIGSPAAGDNTFKYSMERNDTPGDGTQASSWHTCVDPASSSFWDAGASERGTPGGANLSDNDPSLNSILELYFINDEKQAVGFSISNISFYEKLNYEITYNSEQGLQGIIGEIEINGQNFITRDDSKLGTCSSLDKVCVYHTGVEIINLTVTLTGPGIHDRILEKVLEF